MIVQLATFVVVPGTNRTPCVTVLVEANSAKVFEPDIVVELLPVLPPSVNLLYVNPPPAKVLAVVVLLLNIMFEVPAFNVRLVVVVASHTVPVPVNVHVLEPIFSILPFVPVMLHEINVTLLLFVVNVPCVCTNEPAVNASASSTLVEACEIITAGNSNCAAPE